MQITRRTALRLAALGGAAWLTGPLAEAVRESEPILDTHIHLFDPRRPGGIPWPLPNDPIYVPALPERYAGIAGPEGVRGAIVIEASPRATDNDWVLQVAENNPIIVGYIGDLIPGTPEFEKQLDRLHANSLFLGIRCGNLWDRDLSADIGHPKFLDGLKRLASADLTLDAANPTPALIAALLRISENIPELRIVIDHLPSLTLPLETAARDAYLSDLRRLAENPKVFVKLSEIPARVGARVRLDLAYYREHLDQIWNTFGENRILFGSDWPNSDHLASYADTLKLVRTYMAAKSNAQRHKFFWSNSITAYSWKPRQDDQRIG